MACNANIGGSWRGRRFIVVGGLEHGFYFSIYWLLGIIIPTDFHIFQRGWNHQPVLYSLLGLQHFVCIADCCGRDVAGFPTILFSSNYALENSDSSHAQLGAPVTSLRAASGNIHGWNHLDPGIDMLSFCVFFRVKPPESHVYPSKMVIVWGVPWYTMVYPIFWIQTLCFFLVFYRHGCRVASFPKYRWRRCHPQPGRDGRRFSMVLRCCLYLFIVFFPHIDVWGFCF